MCSDSSACLPEQDGSGVEVEVEHVFLLKADVAAKVLAHHTLPRWEECIIKALFELLSQVGILELARALCLLLHKLDGFQTHVYSHKESREKYNSIVSKGIAPLKWREMHLCMLTFLTFIDIGFLNPDSFVSHIVSHFLSNTMLISQKEAMILNSD